jgi:hypothetical protein
VFLSSDADFQGLNLKIENNFFTSKILTFFNTNNFIVEGHNKSGELWVIAAGDICPDDPSENLTSIINMKCGMTMVSITSHKILLENVE